MLSKWPIRNKFLIGIGLLLVIVATLSWSGFHGVYAYRSLVRSFSSRANELPLAAELSREVSELRVLVGRIRVEQAAGEDENRRRRAERRPVCRRPGPGSRRPWKLPGRAGRQHPRRLADHR